jgi:hypothetical protein
MKKAFLFLFLAVMVVGAFSLVVYIDSRGTTTAESEASDRHAWDAETYAREIQGPWGKFHQWTVEDRHESVSGGFLMVDAHNEKDWFQVFVVTRDHQFYSAWNSLHRDQTFQLLATGYLGSTTGSTTDMFRRREKENYLCPDTPACREELRKQMAGGGY